MSDTNGSHNPIDVHALKAAVSLADVMTRCGVELRPVGRNLVAHCPFHPNDTDASLVVNPDRQLWNCFGCQSGGDVLTFLQLKERLDFRQACDQLKAWVGVLPAPPPPRVQSVGNSDGPATVPGPNEPLPGGFTRAQLLERVVSIYAERLAASPAAHEYLASRGLDAPELTRAFRIGVSDGTLLKMLPEQGAIREALQLIGVLRPNGKEHFAGCIVVPLEHPDYGVVGLYGRRMMAEARVAHLYLPGPHRGVLNHQALRSSRDVLLAESVLDALSLWMAGCRDVTCIYGVQGLTRDLEELMGRFATRQVTLCLDGDDSGRTATMRIGEQLMRRGIRCLDVALPEAADANAVLATQGAAALAQLATAARPLRLPEGTPSPAEPTPAAPADGAVQQTGDGFLYLADGLTWRVTPRPPFAGRLKVTLRVQHDGQSFLDNLDLYSHRARATLANQMSRRSGLEKETVERQLLALIEHAEQWIQQQQDEDDGEEPEQKKAPPMSAAEREEALSFLRRPDLVPCVLADMAVMGYVGEDNPKLLGYLIGVSRKLDKPLSGIILSQAGAGKSALTEVVEQLVPPEDVVLYTRMSPQALGYMKRDFLMHKLLMIEERIGAAESEYAIRVLQSRQRLSQAVVVKDPTTGKMHTRHFEVLGPIAYLETTTNANINFENATRNFELVLDESEEQTRRIHQLQREARTREGLLRRSEIEAIRRRHHNAQRLLQPLKIEVPYVGLLTFPAQWLRTRRDHERFLSLVEAVAFLHQHQRQHVTLETADGKAVEAILATVEDYRLAWQLACEVLRSTLHELSRHAQDLWEVAKALVAERQAGKNKVDGPTVFTRRELRHRIHWPDRRLRDALRELVEMEYVAEMEGSQGKRYFYRLLADVENPPSPLAQLTTPEQLAALWTEQTVE
ncbi:MAG: CHC2 zinc finger domain-containing protein [Candidatus Xenobia bacterium]